MWDKVDSPKRGTPV
jgi:CRP-like cAMP-binding protein